MIGTVTGISRRVPSARAAILLLIFVAGLAAAAALRLDPRDLEPNRGGGRMAREFFSAALTPALTYEGRDVPTGTPPILWKALAAAHKTVVFAACAASLSLLWGIPLGFFASASFWRLGARVGAGSPAGRLALSTRRLIYLGARLAIALLRSVHELLWAVLLLAALGFSPLAAVVAIAIPYAGILAKVFSELLDEAPREPGEALRAAGAGQLQVFCFGLLPAALPDLAAYAFYRFECAVRASAVLGFFGFPTLGFFLAASFENLHYDEVWTYLYTLFFLVLALDAWSGALRRRLVG